MRKVRRHAHFYFVLQAPPTNTLNTLKTTKMSEKMRTMGMSLVFPFKRGKCPFAVLAARGCQLFANPSPPPSSNTVYVPQPW